MLFSERFHFKPVTNYDSFFEIETLLKNSESNFFTEIPEIFESGSDFLVGNSKRSFEENGNGIYLIYQKDTDKLIGLAGIVNISKVEDRCFYFHFDKTYQKDHDCVSITNEILNNAMSVGNHKCVIASCSAFNNATQSIIKQLGFKEVLHVNYFSRPMIFFHYMMN
ncbi:MAG: hypothetical protein ACK4GL_08320 [Flavobacteriales bacterium]